MTFSEFKDSFYLVRENRLYIKAKQDSLQMLIDEWFDRLANGAVDYSKERLKASLDPDKSMIESIYNKDERIKRLETDIRLLKEENRKVEELIYSVEGMKGEILRKYFVENMSIKAISKQVHFAESYCWELIRKAMRDLYREEENK